MAAFVGKRPLRRDGLEFSVCLWWGLVSDYLFSGMAVFHDLNMLRFMPLIAGWSGKDKRATLIELKRLLLIFKGKKWDVEQGNKQCMLQKWYHSRFSSSMNSWRALGGNTVLWKCWPVLWDGDHYTVSRDPFAPSNHSPTFCYFWFCSSTSTPGGSEPEWGRRPPLGGKILSIFTFCACFRFIFNVDLQDQRFFPRTSQQVFFGALWSLLNWFPKSRIRMLCLLIHWVTHWLGWRETWPFHKLLRCLLSPLNTLLSNF